MIGMHVGSKSIPVTAATLMRLKKVQSPVENADDVRERNRADKHNEK